MIAGASGYIGKALIPKLLERFPNSTIVALSRSQQKSDDPRVVWKACDLFSLKSLEEALPKKADLAFYLVHSMGPTADLDQGSFADYDLLLADNFARILSKIGIRHLIYLGGLVPEADTLSLHLQSRLEMEETFAQYLIPTTVFRAALILGQGGSSFQILLKLVQRLPMMICPRWTQTLTTPVDLGTVLDSLVSASLDQSHIGEVYDLAGCRPLTYIDMMRQTAKQFGKRRLFLTVPFFTPTLSRLWVSLITNSPRDLVYPLIESLEHPMVARETNLYSKTSQHREYSDLIKNVSMKIYPGRSIFLFKPRRASVRSVQRLPLPGGKNAEWVKNLYLEWLPQFLRPLIHVRQEANLVLFSILFDRWTLLELKLSPDRSDVDRQLLYVVKGFLAAEGNRGRLEFRVVLNRRFVLAALHDFSPSIPWYIYKYTQAKVHLRVMNAFARHLEGILER